jgi:hypothetical protein
VNWELENVAIGVEKIFIQCVPVDPCCFANVIPEYMKIYFLFLESYRSLTLTVAFYQAAMPPN